MTEAHARPIEYTIYTFAMPLPDQKSDHRWTRHATLTDARKAMDAAKSLHASQKFHRVEIKKRFFDHKEKRTVDKTMKIFTQARRDKISAFLRNFLMF